MNSVQDWGSAISMSLFDLWDRVIAFLPSLVGALVVFLVGLIIASALGRAVEKIINIAGIDKAAEKIKFSDWLQKTGIKVNVSGLLGGLTKWFLILVFLMAASDILNFTQVSYFLNSIILYIPNIVVAVVILSLAFLLGNFVYDVVHSSVKAAGVMSASFLAVVSKWAIIIFGLLAALIQLGIAESMANTIFTGIIAALSLAAGLAFGLGGKEEAALVLKKIREDVER